MRKVLNAASSRSASSSTFAFGKLYHSTVRVGTLLRLPAATATTLSAASFSPLLRINRRHSSTSGFGDEDYDPNRVSDSSSFVDNEADLLEDELASVLEKEGSLSTEAALSRPLEKAEMPSSSLVKLERLDRPPGRFDLLTNSLVYRWQTTAAMARKVSGPMREWSAELKYRTGVHMELEPTNPERLLLSASEGGYATADDVDVTVYLFGSERGIYNCHKLIESAMQHSPSYVRLGVFRRKPGAAPGDVEWLMLRRINRELRPPDIPPISLKLPGKWTLLYEQYKEAAIRTLWEETGITVDPSNVFATARLEQQLPAFYWRVPVHYFVAEVPYDVEVLGPQVVLNTYMHHWDPRLLRQSPDPIDRAWAQLANPETGCAWMRREMIDELQRQLRGDDYMMTRYTPPPYSNLAEVLGFELPSLDEANVDETSVSEGTPVSSSSDTNAEDGKSSADGSAGDSKETGNQPGQ